MARRILMAAYACEPHSGSEPAVGWNWALQAALAGNEVHVVTRANNRSVIEDELAANQVSGLTFHYLDLSRLLRWLKGRTGTLGLVGYYYLWQLALYRRAKKLHVRYTFDIAHHVTFANDWLPSGLAMIGIPFVWGPIGGSSHHVPEGFDTTWSRRARTYERTRALLQKTFLRFDPLLRKTQRNTTIALPYTEEAAAFLPGDLSQRSRVVTHIGIEPRPEERRANPGLGAEVKVVTGGRLVHWKGFDLLLEAMAINLRSEDSKLHLVVTGDGSEKKALEEMVTTLDLEEHVVFTGRLPEVADVEKELLSGDVYALLTLRDGPPVGILEAMNLGLPILYLDNGATAELVPDGAGFGIPLGSREETIASVAEVLTQIEAGPSALLGMGELARRYVREVHSWSVIGEQITSIYDTLDGS